MTPSMSCRPPAAFVVQRPLRRTLLPADPRLRTATSRPVAMLLRPGKTPSGDEVRRHLRRLVRRIRSHWPTTRLIIRGDGHYSRPQVMAWCEANDVDYVFGLPGNGVLSRLVEIAADDVRVRRAEAQAAVLRRYTETRYGANPGAASGAWWHASKPAPRDWTSATW